MMRISFCETGGAAFFPGLSTPRTLEVDTLPAPDQHELRTLVEASRFFALPQSQQPTRAPRGAQHYTLTVSEGERQHTVCLLAPVEAGPLQGLVQCVRRHVRP